MQIFCPSSAHNEIQIRFKMLWKPLVKVSAFSSSTQTSSKSGSSIKRTAHEKVILEAIYATDQRREREQTEHRLIREQADTRGERSKASGNARLLLWISLFTSGSNMDCPHAGTEDGADRRETEGVNVELQKRFIRHATEVNTPETMRGK